MVAAKVTIWIGVADPFPMKRELKALGPWSARNGLLIVADPFPMKRELKKSKMIKEVLLTAEVADPFPMKRELKALPYPYP